MALILGIANGTHDSSAVVFDDYRLVAAVPEERITRGKGAGGRLPEAAINEALYIAGATRWDVDVIALARGMMPMRYFPKGFGVSFDALRRWDLARRRGSLARQQFAIATEMWRWRAERPEEIFDVPYFLSEGGFRSGTQVHFFDHHTAHALQTLFHNPDWDDALLYTCDGGGDRLRATARHFSNGRLQTLFGDQSAFFDRRPVELSVANLYGLATELAGFVQNRHEGKLTGLAARGTPKALDALLSAFRVEPDGRIRTELVRTREGRAFVRKTMGGLAREDIAASVQAATEQLTLQAVNRLLETTGARKLGLSGGLFANVLLNQKLLDQTGADEVFIYPAMSDQGLSEGGALDYLLARDGLDRWLDARWAIDTLYLGRDYDGVADRAFEADARLQQVPGDPVQQTVSAIVAGQAVAIFKGRMEFGPRALGARSVLASPEDATINDTLNARMDRSEFMPFAPFIAEEDADLVFDLPAGAKQAARFMTITCPVKPEWRDRLPAVTHVDGTARPQLIRREDNPLYYDILQGFKAATGLPALINTSFNAHEEPIINTPAECAQALADDRVDGVATVGGVWRRG